MTAEETKAGAEVEMDGDSKTPFSSPEERPPERERDAKQSVRVSASESLPAPECSEMKDLSTASLRRPPKMAVDRLATYMPSVGP